MSTEHSRERFISFFLLGRGKFSYLGYCAITEAELSRNRRCILTAEQDPLPITSSLLFASAEICPLDLMNCRKPTGLAPLLSKLRSVREDARAALEVSIVTLLKDCTRKNDLHKGSILHANCVRRGLLQKNIYIGSTLINMYAKCDEITRAHQVFDEIPNPDVVVWNALIAGYAQHGCSEAALKCFQQMQDKGLSPSSVTCACILKACSDIGAIEKGEEIHAEMAKRKLLEKNSVLGTALVDMYAKCGALAKAQQVFEGLLVRDMVLWNAIIKGYAKLGYGDKALKCYNQMKSEGFTPNSVTFMCALQACSIMKAVDKGKEIHSEIARLGILGRDVMLGTALVDMYGKCGVLALAREVFDKLPARDAVSWNALLSGYCQHGDGDEVHSFLEKMQQEGLSPNFITLLCALQACLDLGGGTQIHAEIVRKGLLKKHNVLGNALVNMYANCGALSKAQEVLDSLKNGDRVGWTALISGYCQYGHGEKALKCYEQMRRKGLSPDAVTYACVLQACGSIGAAELGKKVHAEIVEQQGLLAIDCALGSALVDMYAKCGAVAKAQEVFEKLPIQNVDCWTAIITAFAQIGRHDTVFELFNRMVGGVEPNVVTFIVLLYACSSLGLVEKGQFYFETMCTTHGVVPTLDHCRCMVDLFGRVGHFDRAMAVANRVSSSDYLPVCFALLDASQKWRNAKLGTFAFEHAVQLLTK